MPKAAILRPSLSPLSMNRMHFGRRGEKTESPVYARDLLDIMTILGDIRAELQAIRRLLENDDAEEETNADS